MRPRYPHWRNDLIRANRPVREATNKILEMIDEGLLEPKDIVMMCLKWMSEDEVKEMCKANEVDLDPRNDDDYPFMSASEDI